MFYLLPNLAGALLMAYNNHGDVTLSPDDVWLAILQGLSQHINANPEKLRKYFVNHEGQKDIVIGTSPDINKINWPKAFDDFDKALQKEVKGDYAKIAVNDFSTSTPFDVRSSQIGLMSSMKKYFEYIMCGCGIKNIHFKGTLDDWCKLKEKVEYISQYECSKWTSWLSEVINQFINTYQGKVDVDFWNKLVDWKDGFGGSGMRVKNSDISGWILAFFPYDKYNSPIIQGSKVKPSNLPNATFQVPVIYAPGFGKKSYNLTFLAGFSGINYENGSYLPQRSIVVANNQKLYTESK